MFFNISAEDNFTKSVKKYLTRLIIYYTLNGVFFHDLELADPEVDQNVVGSDLGNIIAESYKMADKYDMPILYSCHPRSRNRLAASGFELDKRVIQHEPFGFHDYNCLQMNAFAVVSDSGTLPEESSFFIRSRRCASAPLRSARKRWIRAALCSQALTKKACCRL